jgi:hypothetical protein
MVAIDAGEAGKNGFEAGDRAARERPVERPGRTENTVALRHEPRTGTSNKNLSFTLLNALCSVRVQVRFPVHRTEKRT